MKNLKKVLALVLAFACAFTMFAGALTFSDVKPGDDYSAAITMLSDLEVISGNGKGAYEPDKAITRAEACVLIANIMNGGKADTARFAGGSNFSDVAKTYWGESAIAYCVQMGVTYGVGGGNFAPNRVITDAEFIAMVTRAMGYDTPSNPLKFPYGNYAAAVDNGLVDNVPYVEGSDCTKGEAAQILYDALFADYARYTANQNIIHNADDDHEDHNKLIEVVFGLARLHFEKESDKEPQFDDDGKCEIHTFVIAGVDARDAKDEYIAYPVTDKKDDIQNKPVTFTCEADLTDLRGYEVVLWGDTDHVGKDFVIKAIETVDGQVSYEWNASMDSDGAKKIVVDGEKIKTDDAVFAELQMKDDVFTKTSGNAYALKDLDLGEDTAKDGNIYRVCDWDNDGAAEFIVVDVAKYAEITSMTNKKIGLESDDTSTNLPLDDDNLKIEGADDLEKGDIVEITVVSREYVKGDDEVVTIQLTKVDSETKELTKLSTKKSAAYYDDEPIDVADKESDNDSIWNVIDLEEEENRGDNYDLYMNRNGFLIKISLSEESEKGYLMILDTGKGSTATNNRKLATVDVLFSDGTYEEDVPVVKDLEITGNAYGDNAYDEDTRAFTERMVVGQIFKYYMNDDGQITKLKPATDKTGSEYSYKDNWDRLTVSQPGTSVNYALEEADVIFVMENGAIEPDDGDHRVETEVENTAKPNWHVDDDKVAVLSVEDLGDLEDMGVDAEFVTSTNIPNDGNSWLKLGAVTDLHDVTIAFSADDNKDIEAAILGVDDIGAFKNDKYVALVTDIDIGGEDVVTMEGAMNGKVGTFESDEDEDLDDVVVKWDATSDTTVKFSGTTEKAYKDDVRDFIDDAEGGRYAEVTVDKDGKIVKIVFMDYVADSDTYVGKDYAVKREIVGNTVNEKRFSIMDSKATYAGKIDGEESIYFIASKSDTHGYDVDEEPAALYSIADIPGVGRVGEKISISNLFNDNLKLDDISAENKLTATINDDKDHDGDYYVVDVAFDKGDIGKFSSKDEIEAVAVFAFEDCLYEVDGEYEPNATRFKVTADTRVAGSVAVHLWKIEYNKLTDAIVSETRITDVESILDSAIKVSVKRKTLNNVGDDIYESIPDLTIANATKLNTDGDIGVFFAEGSNLVDGDQVTVTVAGYGSATFTYTE